MPVQHVDPKILELEKKLRFLEGVVQQLSQRIDYLDRERIRAKNELSTLGSQIQSRRMQ